MNNLPPSLRSLFYDFNVGYAESFLGSSKTAKLIPGEESKILSFCRVADIMMIFTIRIC